MSDKPIPIPVSQTITDLHKKIQEISLRPNITLQEISQISGISESELLSATPLRYKNIKITGNKRAVRKSICLSFLDDDNSILAQIDPHEVCVWNLGSGKIAQRYPKANAPIVCFGFSSRHNMLGVSTSTFPVEIFDKDKLNWSLKGHASPVHSLCFSPSSAMLITGSLDFKIKVWDLNTGKKITDCIGHNAGLSKVVFTASGKFFFGLDSHGLISKWATRDVQYGHGTQLVPQPKRKTITIKAVGSAFLKFPNRHRNPLDSAVQTTTESVLDLGIGPIKSISPSSRFSNGLLVCSTNQLLVIKSNDQTSTLAKHDCEIKICAFSSDGQYMAFIDAQSSLYLVDVDANRKTLIVKTIAEKVIGLCVSKSGNKIACYADDRSIMIFPVSTGVCSMRIFAIEGSATWLPKSNSWVAVGAKFPRKYTVTEIDPLENQTRIECSVGVS